MRAYEVKIRVPRWGTFSLFFEHVPTTSEVLEHAQREEWWYGIAFGSEHQPTIDRIQSGTYACEEIDIIKNRRD